MKIERRKIEDSVINNLEVETIETTPEDGFVQNNVISSTKSKHNIVNKKYMKGYSKTVRYTTNDPRVTRPAIRIVCGILLIIGLVFLLLLKNILWGIIIISMAIFTYYEVNKGIDKVAEELKNQGKDVTIDSKEEAEQIKNELASIIKDNIKDVISKKE